MTDGVRMTVVATREETVGRMTVGAETKEAGVGQRRGQALLTAASTRVGQSRAASLTAAGIRKRASPRRMPRWMKVGAVKTEVTSFTIGEGPSRMASLMIVG